MFNIKVLSKERGFKKNFHAFFVLHRDISFFFIFCHQIPPLKKIKLLKTRFDKLDLNPVLPVNLPWAVNCLHQPKE